MIVKYSTILHTSYSLIELLERIRSMLDINKQHIRTDSSSDSETLLVNRQIMVMDDDINVQDLFKINLERLGCIVIQAYSSEEAVSYYQQSLEKKQLIDIIIMDLNIPGGPGGKETAEKIRELDTNVKIIISSGHSSAPEMTNCKNYGFDAAIEKTFNRKEIKHLLETVLELQ